MGRLLDIGESLERERESPALISVRCQGPAFDLSCQKFGTSSPDDLERSIDHQPRPEASPTVLDQPRMASRSAQDSIFSKKRKRDLAAVADDGDSDDSDAGRGGGAAAAATSSKKPYKSKVLILSSRGITYHMRHLMNDVADLVTHGKRGASASDTAAPQRPANALRRRPDTKLDTKHTLPLINELAELSSCNHALFFEARRRSDLYLWAARCPNGPSVRFHVVTLHTMGEVKMTGASLVGVEAACMTGA